MPHGPDKEDKQAHERCSGRGRVRVMSALRSPAGHRPADGLFVESLMVALSMTGSEATARLADFATKRAATVATPSES
jgi:hypothetical protein